MLKNFSDFWGLRFRVEPHGISHGVVLHSSPWDVGAELTVVGIWSGDVDSEHTFWAIVSIVEPIASCGSELLIFFVITLAL